MVNTPSDLRNWLERDLASTDQVTDAAISAYKEAKAQAKAAAAPWEEVANDAKALLADIITETGVTSFKTASGMAYLPTPGVTISYDAVSLDALCASDDNVKRLLWPHRSEKERPGSLTIR